MTVLSANEPGITINIFAGGSITAARQGYGRPADGRPISPPRSITSRWQHQRQDGSGINLDGFNARQTATIVNGGTITGNGVTGDGDGIDVDGLINLTNTGTIKSLNSFSSTTPAQSEGITVAGAPSSTPAQSRATSRWKQQRSRSRHHVGRRGYERHGRAHYANSVITTKAGGLIKGQSDSAIAVAGGASGFTVTSTTIPARPSWRRNCVRGLFEPRCTTRSITLALNAPAAARPSTWEGNNTLHVTVAPRRSSATSRWSGCTNSMTISPGAGNHFTYSGAISNFYLEVQAVQ